MWKGVIRMAFGKPKEPTKEIPVLTIDHYPGREYEVIGMVTAEHFDPKLIKRIDIRGVFPKIQDEAQKANADAVIGVKLYQYDAASVIGYGTAIKFL